MNRSAVGHTSMTRGRTQVAGEGCRIGHRLMSNAYVARQPIFDRDLEVVGSEPLLRTPPVAVANVSDHQAASSRVVLDTLTELGLDQVVGTKLAWINVSRSFLLNGLVSTLPSDRVGL